jgi:hypothetical protein
LVGTVPGLLAEQILGPLNVLLRDKDATLQAEIEAAADRGAEFDREPKRRAQPGMVGGDYPQPHAARKHTPVPMLYGNSAACPREGQSAEHVVSLSLGSGDGISLLLTRLNGRDRLGSEASSVKSNFDADG